uniref:BZIP domain-containing protein n=1 Tax=Steinernema glaseri TaxID=37863 RepID=A0A1I7Y8P4_9BILA
MANRPSVICAPGLFQVKCEDEPQDLSMKTWKQSRPTELSVTPMEVLDFSSTGRETLLTPKRESHSPITQLTPTERISAFIDVASTSTSSSTTSPPLASPSLPRPASPRSPLEQQPRRRGRPRLPDNQMQDSEQIGDSKIFQKRLYARQYRERIKTQLDAKQELQRKLNEIRAQNEMLQKEIDMLKQQNQAYKEQSMKIVGQSTMTNLTK